MMEELEVVAVCRWQAVAWRRLLAMTSLDAWDEPGPGDVILKAALEAAATDMVLETRKKSYRL